jgi:hypothetical protein
MIAVPRPWAAPLVLGLQEGRRIVLHPLALIGLFLTVLPIGVVGDNGPREAFEVFLIGPNSYYGVLIYFVAWYVASRDRRAHTGELLAAVAVSLSSRVAGLCAAALVPAPSVQRSSCRPTRCRAPGTCTWSRPVRDTWRSLW